MAIFAHQGRKVVYDRAGSGPPIVFLHNAGAQRHIWDDQVAALRHRHEVFALDLPGYGESDRPASGYELSDYARMLGAFLDAHELREVVLVGNCLGSATSLAYAMAHPSAVRALVLISPLTRNTVRRGQQAPLAWLDGMLPLGPLARRIALPDQVVSLIVANQLGSRGRRLGLRHSRRLRAHWGDPGRLQALHGLVQGFPAYRVLDEFTPGPDFPPICTIWGKQNRILSASAGAVLDRTLRPRSSVVLADCGHLPMVEDPDAVTTAITDFLTDPAVRPYRGGRSHATG
ncbi:alpha/beta hydrolase [Nocardia puris]|uniref:Pimeloyl-ACP methyl ester carboxylesterase n=1 Tax=Nocardia puris TaxID=208602 RepID=A0A366CWJ5_9NOCA|nr:alpha/beta hydrolase [Nocardia puris]MBF6216001.1 alpha/beta hydrolase [Nocardia puris]MBF6370249.1 alpha/beta hydrolase [Nocardia puris]RBO80107.1 pimeloyl-ACP methyl ester carboxylesterase [Nocardia puris]